MRIAITTCGGDAPGLNAVIRAATTTAERLGHTMFGIRHGFDGLLAGDGIVHLTAQTVDGIEREGGTILGAANNGLPFGDEHGPDDARRAMADAGIDALLVAGGDGTMRIAHEVARAGVQVVGLPKTIDRDLVGTATTFGFDSAVNVAREAVDRLHSTAASHNRLMVVEVMGRDTGWIALYTGIAAGADMIAIPEIPYRVERYAEHVLRREEAGADYHILLCAEGAHPVDGEVVRHPRTGRYGGIAEQMAARLSDLTGKTARSLSLGHLLRGGRPTTFDRVLGQRLGSAAVGALTRGDTDVMVSYTPPGISPIPLADVVGRIRCISPDTHELATAKNLGICLGS